MLLIQNGVDSGGSSTRTARIVTRPSASRTMTAAHRRKSAGEFARPPARRSPAPPGRRARPWRSIGVILLVRPQAFPSFDQDARRVARAWPPAREKRFNRAEDDSAATRSTACVRRLRRSRAARSAGAAPTPAQGRSARFSIFVPWIVRTGDVTSQTRLPQGEGLHRGHQASIQHFGEVPPVRRSQRPQSIRAASAGLVT